MRYLGKERRAHKVFVTRNTEYHVRGKLCVGVRDRRTGEWLRAHLALRGEISFGLRFDVSGGIAPSQGNPAVGDSLFLHAGGRDLVTSTILSVERPAREHVSKYLG